MTAADRRPTTLDDALSAAYTAAPYYSAAIARLRMVADPAVPTMATSRHWVTHYNPATLAGWTPAEAGAVIVHELEHLLREHPDRCGDRDPKNFNIAADAEINQRMTGLPDGAVYPSTIGAPDGLSAETYYSIMGAPQPPQPQPGGGQPGQPGDGDGDGSGGQPGQPGDGQPSAGSGGQPGQPGDGHDCGSAAGGPDRDHERGDAGLGPSADAVDRMRQDAAQRILGDRGEGAGSERRAWAETELGIDRARWYSALSGAVGTTLSAVGAPTRWLWPGRRDAADLGGAMVPRYASDRPSCAVVIDTSGSITPYDLDIARTAAHYLARIADVRYYGCDWVVTDYGATLPDELVGGGGTDMTVGIERAIADGARAVVVITDCQTPWPTVQTAVPVIVAANVAASRHVAPDGARTPWTPPAWMTVIPMTVGADE